jgi:hypothetical protein
MSITLNATFQMPYEDFKNLNLNNVAVEYSETEEKLKLFLIKLYLKLEDKDALKQLWHCIISSSIINECVNLLQTTKCDYIIDYFKCSVNENTYASILEDDDFYMKLINLVIEDNDEYIINALKSEKPAEDTFESVLSKMGITEEGKVKARKIKSEMVDGKPDINKIMAFIQEYKQNFDSSNVDLNTIYSLMTKTEEKPTTQLPFDLNSMMNMIGSIGANMAAPKAKNHGKRGQRR